MEPPVPNFVEMSTNNESYIIKLYPPSLAFIMEPFDYDSTF